MRSRHLALALAAVALTSCGHGGLETGDLAFVTGYETGMAQARQQNQPAMLFFTASW